MSPDEEQFDEAFEDEEAVKKPIGTEDKTKKKKEAHADEIEKVQSKKKIKVVKKKPLKPVKKRRVDSVDYTGRDIGIDLERPIKVCSDRYCPFHGKLSVRGQIIKGVCVSTKMNRTAIIQNERRRFSRKYERYEKRTKKISAHNPECLEINVGEPVAVMECRPISKTVSFVIVGRT
jgi:small subunit ribosomal protein S17